MHGNEHHALPALIISSHINLIAWGLTYLHGMSLLTCMKPRPPAKSLPHAHASPSSLPAPSLAGEPSFGLLPLFSRPRCLLTIRIAIEMSVDNADQLSLVLMIFFSSASSSWRLAHSIKTRPGSGAHACLPVCPLNTLRTDA